jgi:signal transduction histidine kinase
LTTRWARPHRRAGRTRLRTLYRVDTTRTRESGGVGFRLSIVAAVAEAHGGSVRVRETPGGATFVIELPLARGPDAGD